MSLPFKHKILITSIFFSLFTTFSNANDCLKVYTAPIFTEDEYCDEYCFDMYEFLLRDCIRETTERQFATTFNFFHNNSFTCILNDDDAFCSTQYSLEDRIFLEENQYYGMKPFIFNQIEKDQECGKEALVIFITNPSSCQKIDQYPDIDELFGQGLEKTTEDIFDKKIYFLFVLIYHISIDELKPCNDTINELKFTENNNIQTVPIHARYLNLFTNLTCAVKPPKFWKADTSVKPELPDIAKIVVSIVGGVLGLFLILFVAFWINQIRRRYKESQIEAFADAHTRTARHIIFGKYKDEWEVTPKELKVDAGTVLGKGAFGVVYKGFLKKQRNKEWIEMDVAVKFTTEHSTEAMRQDMISEIGFMKSLGSHENLLVMVGYVKSIDNPVICTVFCGNGDLLGVLRKHELHFMSPNTCDKVEICLLLPDLLRIAIEVCNGLCYLASLNYIHRDIAARNVLLTENMTAKLSDFGLCKKLEIHETTLVDKDGKFPIKYMPHESLRFGEFSTKTDVWAYGILLFEMFSGGKKPMDDIPVEDFIDHLENEGKPIMPDLTPQPIIQLVNEKVFQKYPSRRVEFTEIKQDLLSFYSIVCNVILDDRSSVGRGSVRSSVRSSVTSSVRRRN